MFFFRKSLVMAWYVKIQILTLIVLYEIGCNGSTWGISCEHATQNKFNEKLTICLHKKEIRRKEKQDHNVTVNISQPNPTYI